MSIPARAALQEHAAKNGQRLVAKSMLYIFDSKAFYLLSDKSAQNQDARDQCGKDFCRLS
jgi:hypothetical protein